MEQLINNASSISDLSFLRILQMIHRETSTLVDDLKTYELPSTIPRSPVEGNESFKRFSTSKAVPATATAASISAMLETAMEELFVPYIEGQRYLEKESKSLSELYASFLTNFTRYHVSVDLLISSTRIKSASLRPQERSQKAGKSSLFDRMVNQLSSAAQNTSTSGTSTTSAQAAAAILRYGGLSAPAVKEEEEPLREEDGQLNILVAETMLKWHAEAVGRCVELSPANDM